MDIPYSSIKQVDHNLVVLRLWWISQFIGDLIYQAWIITANFGGFLLQQRSHDLRGRPGAKLIYHLRDVYIKALACYTCHSALY